MPQLLEYIDSICRKKQRDVLYLRFVAPNTEPWDNDSDDGTCDGFDDYVDGRNLEVRRQIIEWLDQNQIAWQPCGPIANENCWESYRGQIYLDVPYDQNLDAYQHLEAFLENPDGSMRFPEVEFWRLSLNLAMKNSHHDEPGFWEKWAEKF